MAQFRVVGYIRPSPVPEIEGPETQRQIIERYCERAGLGLHGFYIDPVASGKLPLHRREAGGRLAQDLRRGDHVVVARVDRLADSFVEAALTLDNWFRQGITVHLLDIPGGRLDADSPQTLRLVEALVAMARAGRRMIGIRVRESFSDRKKDGRRCSRFAPYGYRWERRGSKTFMVPAPDEQVILSRVGELYLQGYPIDEIRQYLAYTWRVKNRNNREFGYGEVRRMAIRGAEMLATAAPEVSMPAIAAPTNP